MITPINNGIITTFHKWSNKGYSVFRSLKIAVKIGVIPVTYSLLILPSRSFAQSDTLLVSKKYDLPEVVINANRKAQTFSELTRVVRVVTREEIDKQKNVSLQDLLEKTLMVDIRQRGSQDVQADINIRGGSFDQVLVLLNGVNITDPQTGHHNLNIPIDLSSIQKIEVLQGPGARTYGPGAFSGAINIITEPDTIRKISLASFIGEHNLNGLNITGNFKSRGFSSVVSISKKHSDGYIPNTDFDIINFYSHNTLFTKFGKISLLGGYQTKGFGANSFYTYKYPNQYEAIKLFLSSIQFEKVWNNKKLKIDFYTRNHNDRFELFRSNPLPWYKGHNYHQTSVYGSKVQFQTLTNIGRFQFGAELRNEDILSNILGDSLSEPIKINHSDSLYYSKGSFRKNLNIYADYAVYFDRISISTGLVYSVSNIFKNRWCYGLDLAYSISKPVKLVASVNRSFRNPTFTDLFYVGPINIGNRDIKPENAITYELGIKYLGSQINAFASLFYRDGTNIIDWVKLQSDAKWQSHNYTNLSTLGAEVGFYTSFKSSYIKTLSINYTYLKSSKASGQFDSYYALDYLNHNLVIGINHQIFSKLEANWKISYQDRVGTYISQSGRNEKYPFVFITDFRVQWVSPKINIYTEANNLFNVKYFDISSVTQPGCWLSAGIIFNYNW